MPKSTWKSTERRIAGRLRAERVPVADKRSTTDVISTVIACEVKHRKSLPTWLHDARRQADEAAKLGQSPVVVLHETGKNGDTDIVLMSLSTFERFNNALLDIEYIRTNRPDDFEQIFGAGYRP